MPCCRAPTASLVITALVVVVTAGSGCGRAAKRMKEATEGARAGREPVQKGEATVKDEEGEGKGSARNEGGRAKIRVDVREEEGGASWTIINQEGETSTGAVTQDVTEEDAGLRFYPGAEVEQGTKGSTTAGEGSSWIVVSLTTKDPAGKVADFYKKAYPDAAEVIDVGDGVHIVVEGMGVDGKTITVAPDEEEGVTRIVLNAGSR